MTQFVEVFNARDVAHAYIVKGALEEEGIQANVTRGSLQGALGELVPTGRQGPQVLVPEEDVERAVLVLQRLEGPDAGPG